MFRKRKNLVNYQPTSDKQGTMTLFQSSSVVNEGDSTSRVIVEQKTVKVKEYADKLGLPSSDVYSLENILRSGQSPEFVNVSGMLDSSDPLDSSNFGAAVSIFDRLRDIAEIPDKPAETAPSVENIINPKND